MFLGTSYLEWAAVLMTALCIFLAGRNNIHTWWTGIVACVLYGVLFFESKLYADATLQVFFIVTGIIGWVGWIGKERLAHRHFPGAVEWSVVDPLPITKTAKRELYLYFGIAVAGAAAYGALLWKFTDAFAPWIDSSVLTLSIVAQLMLMRRKIENWPTWLVVNTLSVPLYFSRELYLSAALYAFCWVNAIVSWKHWLNLYDEQREPARCARCPTTAA